jgi:hypothetical protein
MGEAREIFLEACQTIVTALEPAGYRWVKSECDLVRKDGPFTFRLHFQSSPRNFLVHEGNVGRARSLIGLVASTGPVLFVPLSVELMEIDLFGSLKTIPHVGVLDSRIAAWRKTLQNPIRTDGAITGSKLGYLAKQCTWLEINLANPHTRASRVEALISLIFDAAIPVFDRFHRDEEMLDKLIKSGLEASLEYMEVEHAVFLGGVDAGREVIKRFFSKWPSAESEYHTALSGFRKNGIPEVWESSPGPRLAKAALCVGIEH